MRCPRCATETLLPRALEHVKIEVCGGCHGVWVSRAVLDEIIVDLGLYEAVRTTLPSGPIRSEPDGRVHRCPRCRRLMRRRKFRAGAPLTVDVCGDHGTWFDRHELPVAVNLVEFGGAAGVDFITVRAALRERIAARRASTKSVERRPPSDTPSDYSLSPFDLMEFVTILISTIVE